MKADVATIDRSTGEIAEFDPRASKRAVAKADALIEYAQSVQDWPTLEIAVDEKIEQQVEFVRWWRENVTKNKGGDRVSDQKRGSAFLVADAEAATGIKQQQVSKWAKRLQDVPKYRASVFAAAYKKAMGVGAMVNGEIVGVDNHRSMGTGENEWYTPQDHIERARAFLGAIDLDPASSAIAQERIKAGEFFTKDDDGLTREWFGRVWLNPPYAQPAIQQFAEKMVSEVTAGRVTEAVMLTHNYTDTAWFHIAESAASAICFTRGRIAFVSPEGEKAAPTQGQAFFYYGHRRDEFAQAFASVGFVR